MKLLPNRGPKTLENKPDSRQKAIPDKMRTQKTMEQENKTVPKYAGKHETQLLPRFQFVVRSIMEVGRQGRDGTLETPIINIAEVN